MAYVSLTAKDVQEIWDAGREVIRLSGQWLAAIRENKQLEAFKIRREMNGIKRRIRDKYDVIV